MIGISTFSKNIRLLIVTDKGVTLFDIYIYFTDLLGSKAFTWNN